MARFNSIPETLELLRNGRMIILVDDEDRENEGDLVFAAELVTPDLINFMISHARGLVCLALDENRVEELQLPMMTSRNRSPRQTAFTVSIEAKEGVTTGISPADRARTIRTAVDPSKGAQDLLSPGHIFPLKARNGGVLVRPGHTEGSVDLMRLAGLKPAAVICEIINPDGSMARTADLEKFSRDHSIPIVKIQDLILHRMRTEKMLTLIAQARLPSRIPASNAGGTEFKVHAFQSMADGIEHLAITSLNLGANPLVRVHSECLTGDSLFSARCDCGEQLQLSLKAIAESGNGILIYLREQEGRGIGLGNKIRAYSLQDQGWDTVEANHQLGFKADHRHYGIAAQILHHFGASSIKLLSNNPLKRADLELHGIHVQEMLSAETNPNPNNQSYLRTKREKMGHSLKLGTEKSH